MKRRAAILTFATALAAATSALAAEEGRFDAQVFRPWPPRETSFRCRSRR